MTVFSLLYLSFFLVFSGVIYDLIVEPPAIGQVRDERTGAYKPEAFLRHRINGQYIIEGLAAGAFFCLGGLGLILLNRSNDKSPDVKSRYLLITLGVICFAGAFIVCNIFLRIKFPGYMQNN